MTTVEVREARPDEEATVRGILNAAMLEVDDDPVERSVVLVAVDDGRIVGTLVLDAAEIDAVAVRPGRRGQGVGSVLVAAAVARRETVTAAFDRSVRPFYESLGFDIVCESAGDHCRGRLG